jgi:hypothetical protein
VASSATLLPLLLLSASCVVERSGAPDAGDTGLHVLRMLAVPDDGGEAFQSQVETVFLPAWQQLESEQRLEELKVFEVTEVLDDWADTPTWTHLILARLPPGRSASEWLAYERELTAGASGLSSTTATLLRTEVYATVPESYYPWPHPSFRDLENELHYLVEYIDVKPERGFEEEYRRLMTEFFGPGNGLLYQEGARHGFLALESRELVFSDSAMPAFDQVHISAAATDVWGRDLMDAVQRLKPSFEPDPTIQRLMDIRQKLREELARELVEYRVRRP